MIPISILARNFLLDWLLSGLPRIGRKQDGKTSILLVRLDAIGDFVLWLDVAAGLRTLYPPERYRLVLLGNALWADLALDQPCFDEVIPLHTEKFAYDLRYRLALWRLLRGTSWQTVINPTFSRHLPYDDAIVRICGAKERIGSRSDLSNQRGWELKISNRWYSRLIPAGDQPMMELKRNAEFLRALGLPDFRAGLPSLVVRAEPPADLAGQRYYVVVPSASLPMKQWPVEKFAELVRKIWKRYGLKAVVCGAPGERELGGRLQRLVSDRAEEIDLRTGTTSLTEFAALIKGALLVIGNDSSAIHIAAAVGTRSFCLAGGAHHGRFVPYHIEGEAAGPLPVTIAHSMECYHCNLNCSHVQEGGSAPCLEKISVDDVWRELLNSLDIPQSMEQPQ